MAGDTEPLGMSDEIRLASSVVRVPWSKRKELMDRLEAAGLTPAAERLRAQRTFTEEQKPGVLNLLSEWQREVGDPNFGEHLHWLRLELDKDVNGDH